MTAGTDRWIRLTTTGCVALLALIAGTVTYLHMHTLAGWHGQPGWVATLGRGRRAVAERRNTDCGSALGSCC
jgi:diadenosine tetraphosphate (Ap4A) HIT family hydrolase